MNRSSCVEDGWLIETPELEFRSIRIRLGTRRIRRMTLTKPVEHSEMQGLRTTDVLWKAPWIPARIVRNRPPLREGFRPPGGGLGAPFAGLGSGLPGTLRAGPRPIRRFPTGMRQPRLANPLVTAVETFGNEGTTACHIGIYTGSRGVECRPRPHGRAAGARRRLRRTQDGRPGGPPCGRWRPPGPAPPCASSRSCGRRRGPWSGPCHRSSPRSRRGTAS